MKVKINSEILFAPGNSKINMHSCYTCWLFFLKKTAMYCCRLQDLLKLAKLPFFISWRAWERGHPCIFAAHAKWRRQLTVHFHLQHNSACKLSTIKTHTLYYHLMTSIIIGCCLRQWFLVCTIPVGKWHFAGWRVGLPELGVPFLWFLHVHTRIDVDMLNPWNILWR